MGEPTTNGNRWRARPVLAAVVIAAVFVIPVIGAIGAAALMGHLLGTTAIAEGLALRWFAILGVSTIVFIGCQRLTRRALSLTVLLRLGMPFPGRAPRRLLVAKRSWTTRDLSRRIDEARSQGIGHDPTVAAEALLVLFATISAHDRKTRRHVDQVQAFTDLIAKRLRLPDDDRDRLRWSALLHDVGKLTLHSDRSVMVDKPGALSDEQWETVRRHPLEGAKLIAPLVVWLGAWAHAIAEHHERFDGGGYPFGLAGQEISMGGRIVAVADSYDAMTSLHSYQGRMSRKAARIELAAYAGAQFDPVVVRAFLALPVSRHLPVAPRIWMAPLPFGIHGPRLARVWDVVGRVGLSAVAATACVVLLVAGQRAVDSAHPTQLSTPQRGGPHHSSDAVTRPTFSGGAGGGRRHVPAGGAGSSSVSHLNSGTRKDSLVGHTGLQQTDSKEAEGQPGGGELAGGATKGDVGSTTTVAPTPTIPTTTVGGTSATGSTTTSTTDPAPPPVVPPSGLTATSDCGGVILLPEISLLWSPSPTTSVTGYVILRGPNVNSLSYSGAVSGRTNASYIDTSVSGLGTTYWYEVEAVTGGSFAVSGPISMTTPSLCLSASGTE